MHNRTMVAPLLLATDTMAVCFMYICSFPVNSRYMNDVNWPANFGIVYTTLLVFTVGMIMIGTRTD